MVRVVHRHRRPQAGGGGASGGAAALSRLCRNGLRLALGDRAGPPLHPPIGEPLYWWHPALTRNWRGSLGCFKRCRMGTRKRATASADARRASAITQFHVHRQRDWISGIRPNKRQAIL